MIEPFKFLQLASSSFMCTDSLRVEAQPDDGGGRWGRWGHVIAQKLFNWHLLSGILWTHTIPWQIDSSTKLPTVQIWEVASLTTEVVVKASISSEVWLPGGFTRFRWQVKRGCIVKKKWKHSPKDEVKHSLLDGIQRRDTQCSEEEFASSGYLAISYFIAITAPLSKASFIKGFMSCNYYLY